MEDAMCIGRCMVKVVKVQDISMKDAVCSMKHILHQAEVRKIQGEV